MRVVPRRLRFGVILLLARLSAPVFRAFMFVIGEARGLDLSVDIALWHLVDMAMRHHLEYEPHVETHGFAALKSALDSGDGVLMVTAHMRLAPFVLRLLHDEGYHGLGVGLGYFAVPGTAEGAWVLPPAASFLLRARTQLRAGGLVLAMIDSSVPESQIITTPAGTLPVRFALLQLAERLGSHVFFFGTHLTRGGIRIVIEPALHRSADDIAHEFVSFIYNVRRRTTPAHGPASFEESPDVARNERLDLTLRHGADGAVDELAVLEHHQRRD
jgi:hypothetical protein